MKTRKPFFVYLIKKYGTPIYVGGSINPRQRFFGHLSTTFKEINNKGILTIEIIEKCLPKEIKEREEYWIDYYFGLGFKLINKVRIGHNGRGEDEDLENIKIQKSVIDKVRDNKKKTGTPIGYFFEQAALEKLSSKIKSSNKK